MVLLGNIGRISLESPWDSGALSLQPERRRDDDLGGIGWKPRKINLLAIFLFGDFDLRGVVCGGELCTAEAACFG